MHNNVPITASGRKYNITVLTVSSTVKSDVTNVRVMHPVSGTTVVLPLTESCLPTLKPSRLPF